MKKESEIAFTKPILKKSLGTWNALLQKDNKAKMLVEVLDLWILQVEHKEKYCHEPLE